MILRDAFAFAPTPICCETTVPLTMMARVGMLKTLYFEAISLFSSTFSLTKLILPTYSCAISSIIGAAALHGPHQGAQKSTKTGMFEDSTPSVQSLLDMSLTWCASVALFVVCLDSILYHLYFL